MTHGLSGFVFFTRGNVHKHREAQKKENDQDEGDFAVHKDGNGESKKGGARCLAWCGAEAEGEGTTITAACLVNAGQGRRRATTVAAWCA